MSVTSKYIDCRTLTLLILTVPSPKLIIFLKKVQPWFHSGSHRVKYIGRSKPIDSSVRNLKIGDLLFLCFFCFAFNKDRHKTPPRNMRFSAYLIYEKLRKKKREEIRSMFHIQFLRYMQKFR